MNNHFIINKIKNTYIVSYSAYIPAILQASSLNVLILDETSTNKFKSKVLEVKKFCETLYDIKTNNLELKTAILEHIFRKTIKLIKERYYALLLGLVLKNTKYISYLQKRNIDISVFKQVGFDNHSIKYSYIKDINLYIWKAEEDYSEDIKYIRVHKNEIQCKRSLTNPNYFTLDNTDIPILLINSKPSDPICILLQIDTNKLVFYHMIE